MSTDDRHARPTDRPGTRPQTFDSLNPATGDVVGTHPIAHRRRGRRRGRARPRGGRLVGRRCRSTSASELLDLEGRDHPPDRPARRRRCTRRPASRTATRSSRSRSPSTTSPGRPSTPRRCSAARKVLLRAADGQPGRDRGVPPARRRRRDRPVELPGLHADGLDRLRAGRRQRGGLQAQRVHARRRRVAGRHLRRGGARPRRCSRSSPASARPAHALCRAGVDKLAFTGSTATGKKVMAACAETLTPVRHRGRRQGRADRRRGRRPRGRRRRRAVGRAAPTPARPASASSGSTSTSGSTTRSSTADPDQAARAARRRRRRTPRSGRSRCPRSSTSITRPHRRRARPRRPRGASAAPDAVGERFVQPTVLVDVPEDSTAVTEETFGPTVTVSQGARHGRGGARWPTPPATAWARRCSRKARGMELARRIRSGMTAVNSVIAFAGDPGAALRRRRRLRLRPDPRRRRAQGVHLRQGDRPAAVQADAGAHVVHPHREGRAAARPADHGAARARDHDPRRVARPRLGPAALAGSPASAPPAPRDGRRRRCGRRAAPGRRARPRPAAR